MRTIEYTNQDGDLVGINPRKVSTFTLLSDSPEVVINLKDDSVIVRRETKEDAKAFYEYVKLCIES